MAGTDAGGSGAQLDALPSFAAGSCRAPRRRRGVVTRDPLVKGLLDSDGELVVITAPAGYGKTTTVLLWDEADRRPFAWVNLDRLDDDPVHLLRHIGASLDGISPVAPDVRRVLDAPGRSPDLELVPALVAEMTRRPPFVLVLDDVHLLGERSSDAVSRLVDSLPVGSTVALVGRTAPSVRLGRRRLGGDVRELGRDALALSVDEARRVVEAMDVVLGADDVAALVERTEGWAGGVHLAALGVSNRAGPGGTDVLTGRDRLLADYLVEEVLDTLPADTVEFLERSAVLERMSPPLLDELLDTGSSAPRLHALEDSGNLFLVPLDGERCWYRYHHLFAELLRSRLRDRDPGTSAALHARASELLERRGDIDGAVDHALLAGQTERAADLVLDHAPELALGGRVGTLARRLDRIGPDAIESSVAGALAWAWLAVATADSALINRTVLAALRLDDGTTLHDGVTPIPLAVAALRAFVGQHGVTGIIDDTDVVRLEGNERMHAWWGLAMAVRGTALSAMGRLDSARECLLAARPSVDGLPALATATEAHLALLALYEGDDHRAERHLDAAREIRARIDLDALPTTTVVAAVDALASARGGRRAEALGQGAIAQRLVTLLDDTAPRAALLCHVLLARTALLLGDRSTAQLHAGAADHARRSDGAASHLNLQLDEIHRQLDAASGAIAGGPALTPAELRVLPYLATHLTLREIADELIISRNTAKSHAVAIYRKLGAQSRSEAVARATALGLVADGR